MTEYISRWSAPLALAAVLVLGACNDSKNDDTLAQDTSLTRDLEMANQDTLSQPALQDVPAGETWSGYPARPHKEALRTQAALLKLSKLLRPLERLLGNAPDAGAASDQG